jgi:hypothetical protein
MKSMNLVALCAAALIASGSALAQTPAAEPASMEKMPMTHHHHMPATTTTAAKEPKTQKEACMMEAKDKMLTGDAKKAFLKDCTSK